MSLSSKKLKRLSKLKPKEKYVSDSGGYCSRDYLSTIFAEYIDSYIDIAQRGKTIPGTVMFIFKNFTADEIRPHATTIKLSEYDVSNTEPVLKKIKEHFPSDQFSLEMIIYARVPKNKGATLDIYFGALDCGGNSVYAIYTYDTLLKKLTKKKRIGLDNVWIPPLSKNRKLPYEPIEDRFLKDIMVLFHLTELEKQSVLSTAMD